MRSKVELMTIDLAPRIGTEIRTDIATLLSGSASEQIRALLEERGVIVFREINMTEDEQVAFTRTLGKMCQEDVSGEGVYKITLDARENPRADYLKSAFFWHIDGTMNKTPILASLMSSRRLSPTGGNTEFCNSYAAYDDLPGDDKAAIADLKVVHSFDALQRPANPEPSYARLVEWQRFDDNVLPLVWTHRSRRKSLVLGSSADYVIGMRPRESAALLCRLRDWATQPQFVYRHEWTLGDMVIWDNSGTMHRVTPYPMDSGRMMHRTKLEGEEPFA